jgi:hypothetical protein
MLKQWAQLYDLFLLGPDKVMAFVKENKAKQGGVGYTYDELRTLIELCYSAALWSADREETVRAKKGMQDCLLQLGERLGTRDGPKLNFDDKVELDRNMQAFAPDVIPLRGVPTALLLEDGDRTFKLWSTGAAADRGK